MKNLRRLVLLGFLISFVVTTVTYNSKYTFAKNGNARFEVIDCPIEGDSISKKVARVRARVVTQVHRRVYQNQIITWIMELNLERLRLARR